MPKLDWRSPSALLGSLYQTLGALPATVAEAGLQIAASAATHGKAIAQRNVPTAKEFARITNNFGQIIMAASFPQEAARQALAPVPVRENPRSGPSSAPAPR